MVINVDQRHRIVAHPRQRFPVTEIPRQARRGRFLAEALDPILQTRLSPQVVTIQPLTCATHIFVGSARPLEPLVIDARDRARSYLALLEEVGPRRLLFYPGTRQNSPRPALGFMAAD